MTSVLEKVFVVLAICTSVLKAQWNPNFVKGRETIVHLFEWKWNDIAEECERFLGPVGFGGVQVSPPNENAVILDPFRPWWERYQPVSYKLQTRSGSEDEFKRMVRRCNRVGVRIYVDAVINHMTGSGNEGEGTGGSIYSGQKKYYPGVPFSYSDFHEYPECPTKFGDIEDYNNATQVRNCGLSSLRDLNYKVTSVQDKVTEYLNRLIRYGVAGFRFDAAKHMWPADIAKIIKSLNDLNVEHGFAPKTRPFIYQEVIDLGNEPIQGSEYFASGRVTEFRYGNEIGKAFRGKNQLKWFANWGESWGLHPSSVALIFIDNHDNQRGHGAGGENVLTFRNSRLYKMAQAFMLAHPYGVTRIMSSYNWEQYFENGSDKNDWVGPPNSNGITNNVTINDDMTCGGGWVCEHRWRQIYNMVQFRNVVHGAPLTNWWDNGSNGIAFSRGWKGFIAVNNDNFLINATIKSGMQQGEYCDVISGHVENGTCTGKTVVVDSDGLIQVTISNTDEDPVIAIHEEAKLQNDKH